MAVKKSKNRPEIPKPIQNLLWAKSAGRCHLCNKLVYEDPLTFAKVNLAILAHIIGYSPNGPRGDEVLSGEMAKDINNLMLMCLDHAKSIDTIIKDYPVELLRKIKKDHEDKVLITTSIPNNQKSHVLLYGSRISDQNNPVNFNDAKRGMLLDQRYPAENNSIAIHVLGSDLNDNKSSFWEVERANLNSRFNSLVKPGLETREISHLSVFALAAMPLLIELGSLLTDKTDADIYQLRREPRGWSWSNDEVPNFRYIIKEPSNSNFQNISLVLSLSGTIANQDIEETMGSTSAIWEMTVPEPGNDFMKSRQQLRLFRQEFRKILNKIKEVHGSNSVINLFPAVPVSIAVEIGRVWMPKADLPMLIYDRNRGEKLEFKKTFKIG